MSSGNGEDTLKKLLDNTLTSFEYTGTATKQHLFQSCTALESLSFPNATTIEDYMCDHCTGLTYINFPNVITIKQFAFQECSSLTMLKFPELTTISGQYAMAYVGRSSTNGVTIILPKIQTMGTDTFRGCKTTAVDLGADLSQLPSRCMYATGVADNYPVVILRKSDAIVTLANVNAIAPGTNKTCTIYVPEALISSYQADSSWQTVLARTGVSMTKIEGTTYETHYADGTLIVA